MVFEVNISFVVTFNSRSRQFIILDSKGITAWSHNSVINAGIKLVHLPSLKHAIEVDSPQGRWNTDQLSIL